MKNMQRFINLFFVAVLAIGSFSCKKDPEVNTERIRIHENEKQFSTDGVTISMNLSGSVLYSKAISKMTLWVGSAQDFSDAIGYEVQMQDTVFSVDVDNLKSDTVYYYHYSIYRYSVEFDKEMEIGEMQTNMVSTHNLCYVPSVETGEVSHITLTSGVVTGTVINDGGSSIIERGVCWSTSHNPTTSSSHTTDGSGTGSFTSSLTNLTPNTTYYVRAYATNSAGTAYGSEVSFTTNGGGGGHTYVDLGLPSGLLWATCNVGADSPEDYGDYFAWGETQPKDTYYWSNYQYGDGNTFTKYTDSDGLTTLLPEDDAATANWGSDWRMPTGAEWVELLNNTTVIWTTQNGVKGRRFIASNGNSLFLPAAGYRWDDELYHAGDGGYYWSSSLDPDDSPYNAWRFYFDSNNTFVYYGYRSYGQSVRAVRSSR